MLVDRAEEAFVFNCCLQTQDKHYEEFLSKVSQFLKPHHFASPYRRKVYQHLCSFFDQFRRSPTLQELRDYCLVREKADQMREGIEALLQDVPHIDITNVDYVVDKALAFARKSNLVHLVDEVISNLNKGDVQHAETVVQTFTKVSFDLNRFYTFEEMIPQCIEMVEGEDEDSLTFRYGGLLGELVGPLRPGWLVGVLAPTKRGKTWFLIHTTLQAVLSRLKVYFVSLEMPLNQVIRRFVQMYFGCDGTQKWRTVPDCELNQEGICTRPERVSSVSLETDKGELPSSYEDTPRDYQPCVACRDKEDSHFRLSGWKVRNLAREKVDLKSRLSKINWFVKMYGSYGRVCCYPAYSAKVWDILGDVNILESNGFIPNVIVIDYADLLVPSSRYVEYRHQLDEIWKSLKRLAVEKNCIVVTASQTTRGSMGKGLLEATDVAEDIRKVAHCDLMIGLNQTDRERKTSILRINVIARREGFFDPKRQLKCLSDFNCGRLIIDESWK